MVFFFLKKDCFVAALSLLTRIPENSLIQNTLKDGAQWVRIELESEMNVQVYHKLLVVLIKTIDLHYNLGYVCLLNGHFLYITPLLEEISRFLFSVQLGSLMKQGSTVRTVL